ncbi:MAG: TetR/AcrR family transcriptional regulator [Alphaproteobacteria bacterium]|nr:TetR/AcrR family transcriptional regulator [Alphaproteobacteria bacterium]
MKKLTRRERTHERIVQGTADALERHGLRDFTVEHVIEAAGVSRRTFYMHFSDKDAAVLTLYERVAEDILARVEVAVAAEPVPQLRVSAAIGAFLDTMEQGGRLIAELQADAATPGSLTWSQRARTLQALIDITEREVESALGITLHRDVYGMLYNGLEGLVLQQRQGGDLLPEPRAHLQRVAEAMFISALFSASYLPQRPAPDTPTQER